MYDLEMDEFFQELQLKNDVDNYLQHNQLPKYYKKPSYRDYLAAKKKCPQLNENVENIIQYNNNYNNTINHINETISKCDDVIKVMTLTDPEVEVETCPICITEFEETNYVIPKCGHKVCAICFTNNIKYNKHTGDCCVLCRKRVC